MIRLKTGIALTAIGVALAGLGAAFALEYESGDAQETAAILAAKTGLAQAVATAERKAGGRAMEIGFEDRRGHVGKVYEITVVASDGNVSEVAVDPATGEVLGNEPKGPIARALDRDDQAEAESLKGAHITLANAITAAEEQVGGKAVEAGFESEKATSFYEVTVAKDNALRKATVDGTTGKVLRVASADDDDHEGDDRDRD